MKKAAAKYLAVFFCLLVIGQEFASARVINEYLKKHHSKRSTFAEVINRQSKPEIEESREVGARKKRSILTIATSTAKVLFAVSFIASLGNVGFDLYLSHGDGCCELFDSICDDEDRFNDNRRNLITLSDAIDVTYSEADQLFEYAQQSNYQLQEFWLKIEDISDVSDEIVLGINPDIINALDTISGDIEDEIIAKNATVLAYTEAEFTLQYQTVWDDTKSAIQTGIYLASYPLSLLGARLVSYYIGRHISKIAAQLTTKYAPILTNSLSGNGKAASFFGVKNVADIDSNIQSTVKSITKAKYSKVSWGGNLLLGVQIVSSLATIGLEIWTAYEKVEACRELSVGIREVADKVEEAYNENLELQQNVTDYKQNITDYWDDIRDHLIGEDITLVLEEVKNMTEYAADASRMANAASAIDEWFAGIDGADEAGMYDLLQILNSGLSNVSYTLTCYRNKVRAITYMSQHCAVGDDTMQGLYDIAENDFYLNDNDCIDSSGYTYTTFVQMEEIIEGLAEDQGYNPDCILNSESTKALVCNKYWDAETTATIAAEYSLTNDQVLYFTATCGDKPLDAQSQESICLMKEQNITGVFTVSFIASILNLNEATVEKGLENCDQETTTAAPTTAAPTTAAPTTAAPTTQAPTTVTTTTKKVSSIRLPRIRIRFGRFGRRSRRRRFWGKKKR